MKQKLLSLMSFLVMLIIASCSGDKTEEEILPINPTPTPADTVVTPVDTIVPMKYYILEDGYETPNSTAYLFEDSSLVTINPDTIFGKTIHFGKIQENEEWSREHNIVVFADSINRPIVVTTCDLYYLYNYIDDEIITITAFNYENNVVGYAEFNKDQILSILNVQTRGSSPVATIADIGIGLAGLVSFIAKPSISGYIISLCTLIAWFEPDRIVGSVVGTASALFAILLKASKLNWVGLGIAAYQVLDALNDTYRKIWFGEKIQFFVDSITTGSTSATIYYSLDYEGESKSPEVIIGYRHTDSETFTFNTSAKKGQNTIKLSNLEPTRYYNANLSASGENSIRGLFGQIHSSCSFYTKTPSANTGKAIEVHKNSAVIECRFENIPDGAICGIRYDSKNGHKTISAQKHDNTQKITISDLSPLTDYTYSAYIEYKGEYWNGEEKTFTTLPPDVDGTWTVEQADGEQYTITFDNGKCSWSKDMIEPGGYGISKDGTINFTVEINYGINTMWWDIAYFSGKLDNMDNPQHITGTVYYGWSSQWSERIYVNTTFIAYR